ncbi:ATP/GTP-binding protein [Streptomyces hebeiensis]|uniref:ATP/GTP-binding protein n=1 Tax=Streptomyces hebeiensis TaxID=229486 RepID=A0ABN1V463_9ACTN
MDCAPCERPRARPVPIKIVIAGPFGVGKTTLVASATEREPLTTEEILTRAGESVDDLTGLGAKTTTTVGIDFGRLTLRDPSGAHPGVVLYLFGAPGQARFRILWDELTFGAMGVLVLADTRRFDESFEILDLVEERGLPYAVAVNTFDDSPDFPASELRGSLDLHQRTPLDVCDARDPASARSMLIMLVEHIKELALSS